MKKTAIASAVSSAVLLSLAAAPSLVSGAVLEEVIVTAQKREESLQIRDALRKAGKKVEFIEFPDEGHGFARPENRIRFYALAERFLAEHLGGRCEAEGA